MVKMKIGEDICKKKGVFRKWQLGGGENEGKYFLFFIFGRFFFSPKDIY
jgi:hypothetical protein